MYGGRFTLNILLCMVSLDILDKSSGFRSKFLCRASHRQCQILAFMPYIMCNVNSLWFLCRSQYVTLFDLLWMSTELI